MLLSLFAWIGRCVILLGMDIKVIIHDAEEGGHWAEVPALPGCVAQSETMDELECNLREAIQGWLAAGESNVDPSQSKTLSLAV